MPDERSVRTKLRPCHQQVESPSPHVETPRFVVLEVLSSGLYEVDFSDDSGQTYGSVAVRDQNLLTLLPGPTVRAA